MAQLIGYLSEGEQLKGTLSDPDRLVGELSIPAFLGGGLSEEVKQALLDLFAHLAYTDADGQDYYDALYNAFYPPAELVSISAVYTQSGAVFEDTPLEDLEDDLVVTAHYSNGTTEEVTTYTLSGTLTAGASVVTVTYEDKTTTFNVTVSAPAVLSSITAVYTQSGTVYPTDSLDSLKSDLVVTAHYSDSSTATVTTYTLSGTLTVGTSTITVTYSGKTTTFNVTVTAVPVLSSITAVYTQSGTVYDTDSLDSLKADLVVTAVYSDSSTEVVPSTDYTLSGTLTVGTSTITVSYGGKTTTFTVTVSSSVTYLYNWDFTQSLTDTVGGKTATLSGAATQDSSGLHITAANGDIELGTILGENHVYEIDIADMDTSAWTSGHGRLFLWYTGNGSGFIYRSSGYWTIYNGSWATPPVTISDKNYFQNSTLKIKTSAPVQNTWPVTIYKDNVEVMTIPMGNNNPINANNSLHIGGGGSSAAFSMTITGLRVYTEA